jgi:ketosteroid isomerase-like protein
VGDEYIDLDDKRVLVLVHWSGRGKTSGVELDQMRTKGASLFHLRDGKVTRLVPYLDSELALDALDLRE